MHSKHKPLIAGNWKMHGSQAKVQTLLDDIVRGRDAYSDTVDIIVIPTFVHLLYAKQLLTQQHAQNAIQLGAQNLYLGDEGAFTGEVSAAMLHDIGCQYVLIGHSERRSIFKEPLDLIASKFKAAIASGLKPILCIGETQNERKANQTEQVITEQLSSVIDVLGVDALQTAVIAYEPVWAIGTGVTATPQQAEDVQKFIRQYIKQIKVELAETIRILYGGSMKAENAKSLLSMPNIDGGLIGGASLKADSFLAIVAAAAEVAQGMNQVASREQKLG